MTENIKNIRTNDLENMPFAKYNVGCGMMESEG